MLTDKNSFSAFSREELIDCADGLMFGDGNARLPSPDMLMMDCVTLITEDAGTHGKGEIKVELDIAPSLHAVLASNRKQPSE